MKMREILQNEETYKKEVERRGNKISEQAAKILEKYPEATEEDCLWSIIVSNIIQLEMKLELIEEREEGRNERAKKSLEKLNNLKNIER